MGFFGGVIALLGVGVILLSLMDNSISLFLLSNIGLTVGVLLLIIGFIGFLGSFKKSID